MDEHLTKHRQVKEDVWSALQRVAKGATTMAKIEPAEALALAQAAHQFAETLQTLNANFPLD